VSIFLLLKGCFLFSKECANNEPVYNTPGGAAIYEIPTPSTAELPAVNKSSNPSVPTLNALVFISKDPLAVLYPVKKMATLGLSSNLLEN